MKQIFKLSIILMLFAGTAGTALCVVYKITKPHIEKQRIKQEQDALKIVFPKADSFKQIKKADTKYYKALSKNKELLGFVLNVQAKGYGGDIFMLAGIDINTKKLTGVTILEHQETPGLGANITLSYFISQFIGKSFSSLKVVKQKNDKNILSLTGATISSVAVTDNVRDQMRLFLETV